MPCVPPVSTAKCRHLPTGTAVNYSVLPPSSAVDELQGCLALCCIVLIQNPQRLTETLFFVAFLTAAAFHKLSILSLFSLFLFCPLPEKQPQALSRPPDLVTARHLCYSSSLLLSSPSFSQPNSLFSTSPYLTPLK